MKTNATFRFLPTLALTILLSAVTAFGQSIPKAYSEVYYHKLKPGHTLAEARAIEGEWKKLHQAQANDGFILGWYMLSAYMTTNPNREYDYITIKTFTDLSYLDNSYPTKYLTGVLGADYPAKMTDLNRRMREVKEVAKVEVWETVESASVAQLPAPYKSPIWLSINFKIKEGRYDDFMATNKNLKAYSQERLNRGDGSTWNLSELMLPSSSEKQYDFGSIITFSSMKELLTDYFSSGEEAAKKAMPGVDSKQFFKNLGSTLTQTRQEVYYLQDYAVKTPAPAVALDAKVLDRYVGVYEEKFSDSPNATFTVTREGNQLFEEVTGGRKLELVPLSETRFAFAQMDAELEFIRDASGKVVKRTLTMGGKTSEAKKIN